jgi:hypothetical protein
MDMMVMMHSRVYLNDWNLPFQFPFPIDQKASSGRTHTSKSMDSTTGRCAGAEIRIILSLRSSGIDSNGTKRRSAPFLHFIGIHFARLLSISSLFNALPLYLVY